MKKLVALSLIAGVCVLFATAFAQQQMVNPKAEFLKAVERGKTLFNDQSLGTTGQSCNSCHVDGGTKDATIGKMQMKAYHNERAKFPKYSMAVNREVTLDQVINWCIIGPMKGTALPWDDQRLTDLVAYVVSVNPGPMAPSPPTGSKLEPIPK